MYDFFSCPGILFCCSFFVNIVRSSFLLVVVIVYFLPPRAISLFLLCFLVLLSFRDREVVDSQNVGRWDGEQKNRLRQSQNKTADEKINLLEVR
jgi:hypothetical protein